MLILALGCLEQGDTNPVSPVGKKEIPVITFKNLSPPYLDYEYFQGRQAFDFKYGATSFSLINAWWLAEVSTLVYADEDFVRSRFEAIGLPNIRFFDVKSTQCFVANNDKFAIVAFRGSEIWKKRETLDLSEMVADLKADTDIRLLDWPKGGKVHRGFMEALYEVWHDLLPCISQLDNKGCKIWITGHSLGGALATLCGELYGKAQGIYAFGSPWVGDKNFKDQMSTKVYRIVNGKDIVSRIPSFGIFVHVGEAKFIDSDGIIRDTIVEDELPVNQPRDEAYGQRKTDPAANSFRGFIPAPFRDHVPLLYAVHLWNNLIERNKQGQFFQFGGKKKFTVGAN
jgi:triacylglycerol lipase